MTTSSPLAAPNPIPPAYAVTTLPVAQLASELLPVVGAPNREPLDGQRLDDVVSALP